MFPIIPTLCSWSAHYSSINLFHKAPYQNCGTLTLHYLMQKACKQSSCECQVNTQGGGRGWGQQLIEQVLPGSVYNTVSPSQPSLFPFPYPLLVRNIHALLLWCNDHITKKDGLKASSWPVLQHSLNPSVMLLVTHLNLSGNHSIIHLFFVLSPFHLNYCCTIPLLSSNSSDHKGLLVLLHNDVVIKRPFSNSSRTVWCCSQANCDLACNLNESDWNSMHPTCISFGSPGKRGSLRLWKFVSPKKLGSLHHCLVQ